MFRLLQTKRLPKARGVSLRVERMEERALLSTLVISPVAAPPHVAPTPPIIVNPPVAPPVTSPPA